MKGISLSLDTNCFIDAARPESHAHTAALAIIEAGQTGLVKLFVSRSSLVELERHTDDALSIANTLSVLPTYPIGKIDDCVGTIRQQAGTFADAKRNQEIQKELKSLAKSGNGIRDRGAFIDSLLADVDAFVTSDKQWCDSGPARRIRDRFGLRTLTPQKALECLVQKT